MGIGGPCCFLPLDLAGGWHEASPSRLPISMAWLSLVSFASARSAWDLLVSLQSLPASLLGMHCTGYRRLLLSLARGAGALTGLNAACFWHKGPGGYDA